MRLSGNGVTHYFLLGITEYIGRTACGMTVRPYELTYEDSDSALRYWYRVTNQPDGPPALRECVDTVNIDCMTCLVVMRGQEEV